MFRASCLVINVALLASDWKVSRFDRSARFPLIPVHDNAQH